MLLSRLLLLTEKWQKLKTIRLLIYGSRPRKWKQFAYSKYIRTKITIRKFLFKRELAGSGKIAAYNDFTNVLLRYGRVGSYRLKQKSVSSLRSRLGFNGTLVNKQKQTKILFLLHGCPMGRWPNQIPYLEHTMTFKESVKAPTCSVGK